MFVLVAILPLCSDVFHPFIIKKIWLFLFLNLSQSLQMDLWDTKQFLEWTVLVTWTHWPFILQVTTETPKQIIHSHLINFIFYF